MGIESESKIDILALVVAKCHVGVGRNLHLKLKSVGTIPSFFEERVKGPQGLSLVKTQGARQPQAKLSWWPVRVLAWSFGH